MLQLQSGFKSFGAKTIFSDASFAINEGEHVGVIGPNGAGKTTLFRIITGEDALDTGNIIRSQGLRVGYLSQHDQWSDHQTLDDYLGQGTLLALWELKSLGVRLGLLQEQYSRPIAALSGGYRMRAKLLHLLGQMPDLMMLDEPTNYLDLETLLVLESFLQEFKGAFMLISHDREFLRRTTDHVLEIEAGEITKFNGNLDDYFEQKEVLRQQLEARAVSLDQKRKAIEDFVARFGAKATKARQAQSRLKLLSKMETIELTAAPSAARIPIPAPSASGKVSLHLENVDLGYGNTNVLKQVNVRVHRSDHIAVVGVNGAGKSTLLKAMAGVLESQGGKIEIGHNVSVAYFAQHVAAALDPEMTVLESLSSRAHLDVLPQEILNLAGGLLFSGNDVHKPIRILSGGEKSRVALGQILLQKAPCLIMDEPTNHLDFQTVEVLATALRAFAGTVVFVSHDRSFVKKVATRVIEISDGHAHLYPGDYDAYVWSVMNRVLKTKATKAAQKAEPARNENERELRSTKKSLEACEKSIARTQLRMNELNDELADGGANQQISPPEKLIAELSQLQTTLESHERQWLELSEKLEKLGDGS